MSRAAAVARVAVIVSLAGASFVGIVATVGQLPASAATPARWTVVPTAAGAAYGHLAAVSCPTATTCIAVGTQDASNKHVKFIERWNGKKWVTHLSPSPHGMVSSALSAVQCTSASSCIAVGQYSTASLTKTLALRWNGSGWSLMPTPNPAAPVSGLSGLSCTSSTNCFAVGGSFVSTPNQSSELTLVERWNGVRWTIVPSPNVMGAFDSVLAGVACPSAASCFAVGSSHTELLTSTLVERWDGSAWTIVPSPNPPNSADNELAGVACPTATACLAVGTSGHGALAERWNNASWSIVTSPNPAGATGAALATVSCPSAVRCFAVGVWFKRNVGQRLVELFSPGHNTPIGTPLPSDTKRSSLSGISCASVSSCFAVGDFHRGPSRRPLLLRYAPS